jgi:hypothetical protein
MARRTSPCLPGEANDADVRKSVEMPTDVAARSVAGCGALAG